MTTMSVSELRANLKKALARVEAGEDVQITRDGEIAAVLVPPHRRRPLPRTPAMLDAERLHVELEEARKRPFRMDGPSLPPGRADELVRELRAERDERG